MKSFFKKTALASALAAFAFLFAISASATDYQLLEPLPLDGSGGNVSSISFNQYVSYGYQFVIVLAGVAAVVMIVWGGFDYILTEAVTGKAEGKKKIRNALIGLLLALGSYAILNTINPNLVNNVSGSNGTILPEITQ